MPPDRRLWTITVGVLATEDEVDQVVARVSGAICAEDEHGEACATPWITIVTGEESLDPAEAADLRDAILDR